MKVFFFDCLILLIYLFSPLTFRKTILGLHCTALYCTALNGTVLSFNTVHFPAVHWNGRPCTALAGTMETTPVLGCPRLTEAVQCKVRTALGWCKLHCSAECSAGRCIEVKCSEVVQCAVQCNAVQSNTMHYSAVQCSRVQCIEAAWFPSLVPMVGRGELHY